MLFHVATIQRVVPGFLLFLQVTGSRSAYNGEEGPGVHSDEAIERFYTTWAWRKCRDSYLSSCGRLCESCLKRGLVVPADHVHHKVPITPENLKNPEITLNHANLMALCESCHQEQHRTKRWRCDPVTGRVSL